MSAFANLFPADDFAFRLTLQRGALRAFFAPSEEASKVLAERRHWIDSHPESHVVDAVKLTPVWRETAATLGLDSATTMPHEIGWSVEPDIVVLRRDASGVYRVRGGVVVFPTAWALPEKIGLTLAETHGVVPGLNAAIGPAIDRFLDRLRPDAPVTRSNWGLAATDARNLHPERGAARLANDTPLASCWLRIEHQILAKLPHTDAVLFGIRIEVRPLAEVLRDETARVGLHRALATMPPAMAAYKGLAPILSTLLAWTKRAERDQP